MKTEMFRFKLGPMLIKKESARFGTLNLANDDQVVYTAYLPKGITEGHLELFTLTNNLGLITLVDIGECEVAAMQHHLVNSMEEVAENLVDAVSKKTAQFVKEWFCQEYKIEDNWELDHILSHLVDDIRLVVWEKMDKPEPTRRKKWWQKRLTLS